MMEKAVWILVVAVTVCVTFTSGQSVVWNRKKDGRLHVSVTDIPGVHNVTVTVHGDEGRQSSVFIPHVSADKTWKAVIPDVVKDDVIDYVIEYQLTDTVHRVTGFYSLTTSDKALALGSERYLQRRATTVFYDDFSSGHLDPHQWQSSASAIGLGGFQIFAPENAYVKNNILYIKPTLTVDRLGPNIMDHGVIDIKEIWGSCWQGNTCVTRDHENRPVISATIRSKPHGHIRYGRVEVVAKMPKGDWLWGAIWMMPTESHYGDWPRSGEIDLIEAAGNLHLLDNHGNSVGLNKEMCHIHYGPNPDHPAHVAQGADVHLSPSTRTFGDAYHTYWLDWNENRIKMGFDDHLCFAIPTPAQGFWSSSHQHGQDIWASGGKNAPFDRPFYLILDVAVAGDARFWNIPDNRLPWTKGDPNNYRQFWNNRHQWLPTWHGDDVAMKVKSVKMEQY